MTCYRVERLDKNHGDLCAHKKNDETKTQMLRKMELLALILFFH
jgi:hypothetical protein